MAVKVLKNARVEIDSNDVSAQVKSVRLTYGAELLDSTAMSSAETRSRVVGLKDWSCEITFNQDWTAGGLDEILFAKVGAASFAIKIRPEDATISTSNPEYQGNAFLGNYEPISGGVAAIAETTVPFQGDGALTRATS